ncbi:PEP-CTERM sorting domain-containing protein [Niveibacterium sp. 24ML]|uniref:PEP-CTERM sorting domain-containing protein n=1 Tax=Niveibacterium sp. 24ML TaxID=2985512 RepID=UPI00226FFFCB|nr:PEP-CTERM sorting domain-containing protein [Niveibacterium sp. 24ML]MCX9157122.1 PEP-CTERM sorting domain-containing protein [Niveibacterium sp. 24ML]
MKALKCHPNHTLKALVLLAALVSISAEAGIIASKPRGMPTHDQSELPAPASGYYCGPVAAWNSIEWMYDTYPKYFKDKKPANWKDGVNELAGYMKTDKNKGTWVNDFISGKKTFFEKHANPGSWQVESKNADWDPVAKKWGADAPTWKWIRTQMDKGQDVEVVIRWDGGAHWTNPAKGAFDEEPDSANILTLDYYVWNDVNDNLEFDLGDAMDWFLSDPHQEVVTMSMSLGTSPVAPGGDWLNAKYGNKNVWVTAAVAESIPEPSTILLLGMGAIGLLRVKRASPSLAGIA